MHCKRHKGFDAMLTGQAVLGCWQRGFQALCPPGQAHPPPTPPPPSGCELAGNGRVMASFPCLASRSGGKCLIALISKHIIIPALPALNKHFMRIFLKTSSVRILL